MDFDVKLPTRAHEGDACWDVYSNVPEMAIQGGQTLLVPTGLKVGLLPGWELQIRPRSGLAAKYGLTVLNSPGTIDAGYRGEIKIVLHNASSYAFYFKKGFKVAQMALKPVYDMTIEEVDTEDLLGETERDSGGFGSTGME
jgi:dUTP pyrophosphatase